MKAMMDMDSENIYHKGLIEEYKTLRQEILFYISCDNQIRRFIFLLSIGILGAKDYFHLKGQAFILSSIVVLILWNDSIEKRKVTLKLGTYIATFIEPHVPGLSWESNICDLKYTFTRFMASFAKYELLLAYGTHATIASCMILKTSKKAGYLTASIAILFALLQLWREFHIRIIYRRKQLKTWRELKKKKAEKPAEEMPEWNKRSFE